MNDENKVSELYTVSNLVLIMNIVRIQQCLFIRIEIQTWVTYADRKSAFCKFFFTETCNVGTL